VEVTEKEIVGITQLLPRLVVREARKLARIHNHPAGIVNQRQREKPVELRLEQRRSDRPEDEFFQPDRIPGDRAADSSHTLSPRCSTWAHLEWDTGQMPIVYPLGKKSKAASPLQYERYTSTSIRAGSSMASLIRRRKRTACLPSMRRWSYVKATYIIGA